MCDVTPKHGIEAQFVGVEFHQCACKSENLHFLDLRIEITVNKKCAFAPAKTLLTASPLLQKEEEVLQRKEASLTGKITGLANTKPTQELAKRKF
jgi:hypothetical protein